MRITILVEHISPHSLYAYTTLSARQAGEIKLILENTATWKHWKIRMGNIKIKSILCNTATWKYIWKILKSNRNQINIRKYCNMEILENMYGEY